MEWYQLLFPHEEQVEGNRIDASTAIVEVIQCMKGGIIVGMITNMYPTQWLKTCHFFDAHPFVPDGIFARSPFDKIITFELDTFNL